MNDVIDNFNDLLLLRGYSLITGQDGYVRLKLTKEFVSQVL